MDSFPRFRLGFFPTPLHRLDALGARLGHHALYVKRDDLTGLSLGGNKTRSLEYLLGDALRFGADTVVTAGGLQSNLCSLTAAACAKAGLSCVLVHNDLPPADLHGNMLLNRLFGAGSIFIGRATEEERARVVEEVAKDVRARGGRPYVIQSGASTPLGALGYVGHPFHVHVISVEYTAPELRRRISGLLTGIQELTGLAPLPPPEESMTIHDEYLGGGYAVPTAESTQMLRDLPRLEGIFVENVYTAKTLAGLAGLTARGVIPDSEPACFIHTGGMAALFAQQIA
jgi:1-aminocyclopropane-1-carboxylate deaminase/D-cysteine desulfhydrase-like pyridoxal-dependent ACC family enzyme